MPISRLELEELEQMLFDQGKLGTRKEFIKAYGEQPIGKFIRSILGLDINSAKQAFGAVISNKTLNASQIRFLDTIINFFCLLTAV